jgi:hypothetical protein
VTASSNGRRIEHRSKGVSDTPLTEWAQAGVTGATATMMPVRGLVERDSTGGLKMTPKGREVFKVLIGA